MSDGRTSVRKRSVLIAGHATSVSLEPEFWAAIKDIAAARGISLNSLIEEIDAERDGNLSSAIRVFVLRHTQGKTGD
ncbi:MAG: ribbon-helix-helix domain-containing protein [Rhodospirillales bacterium]|nr:ribbon-helix-helix domain-containing protein [Rhodospirillales bacterium]